MKLKNMKTFEQHTSELNISDVISRLLSLQRVDIDTLDNGEFIEKHERIEEDGRYIISEDLDKLISELKRSL
jgi:predicted transcriptional regulator